MSKKQITADATEKHKNITITIPPAVRYAASALLMIGTLVLIWFSASTITSNYMTEVEAEKVSPQWTLNNCKANLNNINVRFNSISPEAIQAFVMGDGTVSKQTLIHSQLILKSCPGMEVTNLCVGDCGEAEESVFLQLIPQD